MGGCCSKGRRVHDPVDQTNDRANADGTTLNPIARRSLSSSGAHVPATLLTVSLAAATTASPAPATTIASPTAEALRAAEDEALMEEVRGGSMRLGFDEHGSYFAGIDQRMFNTDVEDEDENDLTKTAEERAKEREYSDGYEIEHDGQHVCTIVRRLGKGAMGTVYLGERPDGLRFAVKVLSAHAEKSAAQIAEMEGQLAREVSIAFALGRFPLIAMVIGVVVILPDSKTTAKGLLLLCENIDRGDLEEAMSTKAAVAKEKPDYAGELWSGQSATTWPLASITLQIFLGFRHVHARGVLHQVRSSRRRCRMSHVARAYYRYLSRDDPTYSHGRSLP